jgi:[acyl-carrier-protein] S-malonyltransferase
MTDDLTVALFNGRELRGAGPWHFVRRTQPDVMCGHGFGDLAALVAADALDLEDALRLAVLREQLIATANEEIAGGMLAIVGPDAAGAACKIAERCGVHIARHDSPTRIVVSGSHEKLGRARALAAELGVEVGDVQAPGSLHCAALSECADAFATALEEVTFRRPKVPVYSSVTAEPIVDPRSELARCLQEPVMWCDTVRALEAVGAVRVVESGSASVLGDLVSETLCAVGTGATGAAGCDGEHVHA